MNVSHALQVVRARFARNRFILAACSVLALSGLLFTPALTQASAYGCAFGNPLYGPSQYCVYMSGSGNYVSYVSTSARGSALICNGSATAEFYDTNWRWYQTLNSGTQWGCGTGFDFRINVNGYRQNGYMCSTFRYSIVFYGNRQMSVCHAIHS